MSLDKGFFSLVGPTLIGQGECVAMIADDPKYYVAKGVVPATTDPFSPLIDLIEWLNVKDGHSGSKSARLSAKPIYYIGWDLGGHESAMARQNNWTVEKLPNKKSSEKDIESLGMRLHKEQAVRENIPARAVSDTLARFKISQLAPAPSIMPTDQLQKLYMLCAFSIAAKKAQDRGRVTAILTSAAGEILSYGIKSHENSILHAEVTAIQSLFVNDPDRASRLKTDQTYLFTTLKPCGMCAGMIAACGSGKIHVVYGQDDFGEGASNTCLDAKPSMHHKLVQDLKLKDAKQSMLLEELDSFRQRYPGGPIVQRLDDQSPKELMQAAHGRTLYKVNKYALTQEESEKKRVMAHLESFLRMTEVISA